MVKMLALSVFMGNMLGSSFTAVSTASPPSPAHTPADKFAIEAVYQVMAATNNDDGSFQRSFGTGFFVNVSGRQAFITAGHVCDGADVLMINRLDDIYEAEVVYNGEPKEDLCILKVSPRLKPAHVYNVAELPFKPLSELVSYGYAHGVRLIKLWHKVEFYATIPQVNDKRMMIMRDPTYQGCSGGPVLNPKTGNVAGVIVMTSREVALATPAAELRKAVLSLKKGEYR